ncbi:hypothetical protein LCGC14_0375020 [marine sediment metagenome]|uniref:Uncharacterized protein n=1 Tax=marine sediment metagenome TaxID=412755 RepID=A0A0F9T3X8_9ZZZZ
MTKNGHGYLLTIDPGVTCCGWALFRDMYLVKAGLSRTKSASIEERTRDHYNNFMMGGLLEKVDIVVIEKPQVYQQRMWKGDPNDLIDLAIVVGGIVANTRPTVIVRTITPNEWKGQVPKDVTDARMRRILTKRGEQDALENPVVLGKPKGAPEGLLHNMMDGIAIGLAHLQREGPTA